jgi:hypothetical protein
LLAIRQEEDSMDEDKRETAPITAGSAEGERQPGGDEKTAPHTPGSAEGERDEDERQA